MNPFKILIIVALTGVLYAGQCILHAQPYTGFKKQYFIEQRYTEFESVQQYGDDLIIVGSSGIDSTGFGSFFLLQIDTFGTIKRLEFYRHPDNIKHLVIGPDSWEAIQPTADQGFVISFTTFPGDRLALLKLDSLLNIEFFKEYDNTEEYRVRYVLYVLFLHDAYYAIGHVQTQIYDRDISITKIDTDGNKIWEKIWGVAGHRSESAYSAVVENNGITILATEVPYPYSDINPEWTWFLHIDTSGQVVGAWKSETSEEGSVGSSLWRRDDHYYYTTRPHHSESGNLWLAAQLVCRDSLLNLKWRVNYSDTFAFNGFNIITFGPDDYLYAAGQIFDGVTWGRVCKIDPENGDLIWDARDTAIYIPGYGSRNRMQGITVVPGGSVFSVGFTEDVHPVFGFYNKGLLFKVTKDGCIDTLCTTTAIDDYIRLREEKMAVYPNPARDEITIEMSHEIPPGAMIRVYSLQGMEMYRGRLGGATHRVDVSGWSAGVYIAVLPDRSGKSLARRFAVH